MKHGLRHTLLFTLLLAAILLLFLGCLLIGSVNIPVRDVLMILFGETGTDGIPDFWQVIVLESRLPMAVAALLSGCALGVAGLLMQTTFQNPLAGPSVLGVSAGASLGVAVVMLAGLSIGTDGNQFGPLIGAMLGSVLIIIVLTGFSAIVKSSLMLLIIGMMISYLVSSFISLFNYIAPAEGLKSYVMWGLGSFAGLRLEQLPMFTILVGVGTAVSWLMVKPLNAFLLGERYAENMGYSLTRIRTSLLLLSGFLTATVTSYCGPIGFIGLIVPHIARMIFRTSNHATVLPATLMTGGMTALLCAFLSVMPIGKGIIPVNVVTPVIGVPFIVYLVLNRKRMQFFN